MKLINTLKQQLHIRERIRVWLRAKIIRRSEFFDGEWYLKNNLSAYVSHADPAIHYLRYGASFNRNPSPYFTGDEYYALHYDVRKAKVNPLLHYELHGKKEGRAISFLEEKSSSFPAGLECGEWKFQRTPPKHRRTAVVASYFGDGTLPERLLYLIRGLREVVDNIVLVGDCPINPSEIEKLSSLVAIAKFERHGQYDFGSYRIGFSLAKDEGLLDKANVDELVMINDSCYGPIYPFEESFSTMESRDCDFWGYTGYNAFGHIHISSYFFLFRRKVIESGKIEEFLSRVDGHLARGEIVVKCEFEFTKFLEDAGFTWGTFVPMKFGSRAPTKYPCTICGVYRMPLLKTKTVNGDSYEKIDKALKLVGKANPRLAELVKPKSNEKKHIKITVPDHQASFREKCALIAAKVKNGGKINAVFFVSDAAMFPAKPLFEAMCADSDFETSIVVIPDLRWNRKKAILLNEMENCRHNLAQNIPSDCISVARQDKFGNWEDVLENADIVCYPLPYDLSSFRYNQRYSVGRNFLPITVNYGFYRSKYDRHVTQRESYAYMWKAFFECEDSLDEYKKYSETHGTNADLVGYIKMDALAKEIDGREGLASARTSSSPSKRKTILVAPHHSVEGGTNKELSLANFVRYADFFLQLPDRHPEIDFIFRPHPFLFKVLSRKNQWGPERVGKYIAALKAKPNVIWSDGGDYFREFAASDACIQDCGSYLVEYFYTKKPCCYMLKSPDDIEQKFAPLGKKCLENCYIAYDTNAIEDFIRDVVVSGNDPKKAQREAFADSIMVNYPNASKVALEHIKRELKVQN